MIQVEITTTEVGVTEQVTTLVEVAGAGPQGPQGATGPGVPDGGTTGQVLAKASNADQDTEWSSDYATAAQGSLAETATQPGDNVSTLTNDANYIDSAGAPVQSVDGFTGAVDLSGEYDALGSASSVQSNLDSHTGATTNVHGIADTADLIIEGDARLSDARTPLTHGNEAHSEDYVDAAGAAAAAPVQSVNTQTGDVTLDAGDVGADPAGSASSVQSNLTTHIDDATNPHQVTATQVGLGNVDDTADLDKPISTATQSALDDKADKTTEVIAGTGLDGGGDLSANRTFDLSAATQASLSAADTALQPSDPATDVSYDGTTSGLAATDVQGAIDETNVVAATLADEATRDNFFQNILQPSGIEIPPNVLYYPSPYRESSIDATIARAGSGTIFNKFGEIESVDAGIIRRDYDPETGAFRGALAEPQRTNLLLLANADTLTTQSVTVTNVAHTLSFFGTGEVVLSGAHSATLTGTGALNRVTLTFTPTAGSLTLTVTGTVRWANLEVGAFALSHIPTNDVAVTRPADTLTIPQVGDRRRGFICWQGVLQVSSTLAAELRLFPFGNVSAGTLQHGVAMTSPTRVIGRNTTTTANSTAVGNLASLIGRQARVAYWWDTDASLYGVSVDGVSSVDDRDTVTTGVPAAGAIGFGRATTGTNDGSSHTNWIYISYNIPSIAQIEALTGAVV